MENLKRKVVVLDNGGETCDRYTIIFRETAEMFGCSDMPFSPLGIAQYSCNIAVDMYKFSNASKRDNRLIVSLYLNGSKSIGKRVKELSTLPIDVQKYIKQISE